MAVLTKLGDSLESRFQQIVKGLEIENERERQDEAKDI